VRTKSGTLQFDKEVRKKLLERFPKDGKLLVANEISKVNRAIQQVKKLLEYSDKDRFYPNYIMLGTATGRFQAREPELHNLLAKEPYNIRDLLLGGEGVFTIDFKSQEDRMAAYLSRDPTDMEDFKRGLDVHQELADRLGIEREQGKRVRHSVRYGAGVHFLREQLNIPYQQAEDILENYKIKYEQTFNFIENLSDCDGVTSSIFGRSIKFSPYKEHTKFNWMVQGNSTDLLLRALEWVLESKKVELRAHFHDSLYLKCLCPGPHPCQRVKGVVEGLEGIYHFFWPNSKDKVFRFGEIKWVK